MRLLAFLFPLRQFLVRLFSACPNPEIVQSFSVVPMHWIREQVLQILAGHFGPHAAVLDSFPYDALGYLAYPPEHLALGRNAPRTIRLRHPFAGAAIRTAHRDLRAIHFFLLFHFLANTLYSPNFKLASRGLGPTVWG